MRGVVMFLALLVWVESAEAEELPLTYREALTQAVEANPELRSAVLAVDQAEASLIAARGGFDPAFQSSANTRRSRSRGFFQGFPFDSQSRSWSWNNGFSGTLPTGTSWTVDHSLDYSYSKYRNQLGGLDTEQIQNAYTSNTSLSISQQLIRGVKLSYNLHNVTRARKGLSIAELTLERTKQEKLAETARAYWNWAYLTRLVEIEEANRDIADEALRIGRLRLEQGEIAPVEVTRLEAAHVQTKTGVVDARKERNGAEDTLLLLLGRDPGNRVVPSTQLEDVRPLNVEVGAVLEVAAAQNLDIALQRAELERAASERAYARHARLPSLGVTASAGVGAQNETLGGALKGMFESDSFPFVSVGGTLEVPLGNRVLRGEAERTAVEVEVQELALESLERSVMSQVQQQVQELEAARRKVDLADLQLALARETLASEEALEAAGRSIQKDVLEARKEVHRLEIEAAKTRADFRLAEVELLRLQGQLDVDGL